MTNLLAWPLDLRCGATLSNLVAKAAMSEGLADSGNRSTPRLEPLAAHSLSLTKAKAVALPPKLWT
jgi:hypothetical protein